MDAQAGVQGAGQLSVPDAVNGSKGDTEVTGRTWPDLLFQLRFIALIAVLVLPLSVLLGAYLDLVDIRFEHLRVGANHEAREQAKQDAARSAAQAQHEKWEQRVRDYVGQFAVGLWTVDWGQNSGMHEMREAYCSWNTDYQMLLNITSYSRTNGFGDGDATITSRSTPQVAEYQDDGFRNIRGTPQQLRECGRMTNEAAPASTKSYKVFVSQSDAWTFDAKFIQVRCSGACEESSYRLIALPTQEWDLESGYGLRRMARAAEPKQASR